MRPLHVALLIPLAACALDPTNEPIGDDEPEAIAACAAPLVPPARDVYWYLYPQHTHASGYFSGYGTSECSSVVIGVQNAETIRARPAFLPTSAAACVGTELQMFVYDQWGSGWHTFGFPLTKRGVWTASGCELDDLEVSVNSVHEARVDVRVKRTVCSGDYCGSTYGLAFLASADYYAP